MNAPATVCWLIERHHDFTDPQDLTPHLDRWVPLEGSPLGLERWPRVDLPAVAFGTLRRLTRLARYAPLADAVFDDHSALRCSVYYGHVYADLGRTSFLVPLRALPHMPLERLLGPEAFVRPDANTKPFEARRFATTQDGTTRLLDALAQHLDSLVVVSEVVDIDLEYRCFCRDGRVFAHSSYPDAPFRPAPDDVRAFAARIAQTLRARLGVSMITVDVAQHGHTLRLMEVGGVNSWGLYGCDRAAFVRAMEAEARARYAELHQPP